MARSVCRCAAALGSAFLFLAPAAHAQWRSGLAVGPSAFTITGSERTDFTPRARLGARLWFEREVRGGLGVGVALEYLSKGANGTTTVGELFGQDQPGPERPVTVRLDYPYLEVPVFVSYTPAVAGRLQPTVYAGPHVSFGQPAYASYSIEDGLEQRNRDASVQPRDAGLTAGLLGRFETERFGMLAVGAELSVGMQNLRAATPALHAVGGLFYVGVAF